MPKTLPPPPIQPTKTTTPPRHHATTSRHITMHTITYIYITEVGYILTSQNVYCTTLDNRGHMVRSTLLHCLTICLLCFLFKLYTRIEFYSFIFMKLILWLISIQFCHILVLANNSSQKYVIINFVY